MTGQGRQRFQTPLTACRSWKLACVDRPSDGPSLKARPQWGNNPGSALEGTFCVTAVTRRL